MLWWICLMFVSIKGFTIKHQHKKQFKKEKLRKYITYKIIKYQIIQVTHFVHCASSCELKESNVTCLSKCTSFLSTTRKKKKKKIKKCPSENMVRKKKYSQKSVWKLKRIHKCTTNIHLKMNYKVWMYEGHLSMRVYIYWVFVFIHCTHF